MVEEIEKQKEDERNKAKEEFLKRQAELEREAEEKITRLQVLQLFMTASIKFNDYQGGERQRNR